MVNRIVVSLIIILMLLGVAIYFRVEFKYDMVAKNHSQLLSNELRFSSAPLTPEGRIESVLNTSDKFGIAFADDFKLIDEALLKACAPQCLGMQEYYSALAKVVEKIERKKMWVVRKNRTKDSVAHYIQNTEEGQIIKTLLNRRTVISEGYTTITSFDLREKALEVIKKIDEKIVELRAPAVTQSSSDATKEKK